MHTCHDDTQNLLKTFTKEKTIYEINKIHNSLSDKISKDLQDRGMKFVGTVIIYSYLQAIGVINSHEEGCYKYGLWKIQQNNRWFYKKWWI